MHRIVAVLAVLALWIAPAGVAQAQLGGPNVPTPLQEPPPPPPVVDNDAGDEGLSGLQQLLIFGAAIAVLGLIAYVILRDAKRAAPGDERPRKSTGGGGPPGKPSGARAKGGAPATIAASEASASAIRARERQQAKRAKAKARAVREQRKRNRPR